VKWSIQYQLFCDHFANDTHDGQRCYVTGNLSFSREEALADARECGWHITSRAAICPACWAKMQADRKGATA
jgi:hypothetical protein